MQPLANDIARFIKRAGYTPDLENPRSHCERVMCKKYTDRDPLLALTADKIAVRKWLRDQCFGSILLSLQDCGYQVPAELPRIPCVIKMNNASGRNVFIFTEEQARAARVKLTRWLNMSYGQDKGEWCYQDITPGFIEERLLWGIGEPHILYRWLCWRGVPRYIEAHEYALEQHGQRIKPITLSHTVYRVAWDIQDVTIDGRKTVKRPAPRTYWQMYNVASALSKPFDFVRIDLYESAGKLRFSEVTHYPRSGQYRYEPRSFDYELGEEW